ncbi:GNAT family N-acetyltransferase [Eubacteriales bacterium OttesenSCG-928-N13]|nr:GNAT family N-acetyltransferase [Eubacteriales bacterium OttesenSCG-928-N13]
MILETPRLILRKMTQEDEPALRLILQDPDVMYAYEGAFDDAEVHAWLHNQLRRYEEEGCGLWAVELKGEPGLIGQCGITVQGIPDGDVMEVGYLFQKEYWHQGYATEAARACRDYAFDEMHVDEVFSIIRDTNAASQGVAIRNDMTVRGRLVKHYRGVDMPHMIYSIRKDERDELAQA